MIWVFNLWWIVWKIELMGTNEEKFKTTHTLPEFSGTGFQSPVMASVPMSTLRQILLCLLILNIIGSTLMVPLIYLDFSLRQDYIAEVLCINKEEPITVCGGQCYLIDQLKHANERQEKEATTSQKLEFHFFSLCIARLDFLSLENGLIQSTYQWESLIFSSSYLADIFRPPKIS